MLLRTLYRRGRRWYDHLIGRGIACRPDCVLKTRELGNDGANWVIYPSTITADSVVYSFGIGEDISFDLELIRQFGVTVQAFDPTERSVKWLGSQDLDHRFIHHRFGLAAFDGKLEIFPPQNVDHVSFSVVQHAQTSGSQTTIPVKCLTTIVNELGHDQIEILKMDIEGAEYDVIKSLRECPVLPRQLLVEFHHRFPEIGPQKTRQAIQTLKELEYRIFHISDSEQEFAFIRGAI